jgi:hypothetical protein
MASKNDGEDLARVETKADSCDSPTASKNKLIQPMPWTSEHHVGQMWRVRDDNGFVVFDTVTRDEAEFIVRACNAHSDLLAALSAIQRQCAGHADEFSQRVWLTAETAIAYAKEGR